MIMLGSSRIPLHSLCRKRVIGSKFFAPTKRWLARNDTTSRRDMAWTVERGGRKRIRTPELTSESRAGESRDVCWTDRLARAAAGRNAGAAIAADLPSVLLTSAS